MALIGVLNAPRPANPLVVAQLAIDPASVAVAEMLAAALPALVLRRSFWEILALAAGGSVLCLLSVNLVHWIALTPPRASAHLPALRDLAAASVGVMVAATLSAGVASRA
jgi:hypothetical protein